MFRFLLRFLGVLVCAGAFVMTVVDGTRSIAGSTTTWTPFSEMAEKAMPGIVATLEPLVAPRVPLLWDPVLVKVLAAPTEIVLAVLGALLILLGRRPRPRVGFDTSP